MNVGIIIFSRTGNTLSVAEKVRDACLAQGHTAVIERISAENEDPNSKLPVRLKNAPDPVRFDAVIFGAPVQGFSLSPIVKAYLTQIPQITGKEVGCFVTQHFPKPWMGGKQAAKQMCSLCQSKGVVVAEIGIINWMNKSRKGQIDDVASMLSRIGG
ncbi:MAG: flavodoxin [Clostridiales bacterium]|nr:flavodoxin [Clostridiales bacterium]